MRGSISRLVRLAVSLFTAATAFSATRATAAVGNIFVLNHQTGTVGEYTTDGATVNASLIKGLTAPNDIAVSGTNLFVSGYGSRWYRLHCRIHHLGGPGERYITGLDHPHGIAVSGSNLYFVEDNGDEYSVA